MNQFVNELIHIAGDCCDSLVRCAIVDIQPATKSGSSCRKHHVRDISFFLCNPEKRETHKDGPPGYQKIPEFTAHQSVWFVGFNENLKNFLKDFRAQE